MFFVCITACDPQLQLGSTCNTQHCMQMWLHSRYAYGCVHSLGWCSLFAIGITAASTGHIYSLYWLYEDQLLLILSHQNHLSISKIFPVALKVLTCLTARLAQAKPHLHNFQNQITKGFPLLLFGRVPPARYQQQDRSKGTPQVSGHSEKNPLAAQVQCQSCGRHLQSQRGHMM